MDFDLLCCFIESHEEGNSKTMPTELVSLCAPISIDDFADNFAKNS